MEVLKIALIGIVGIIPAIILKTVKSEYSIYISMAVATLIFAYLVTQIGIVIRTITEFFDRADINEKYVAILLKMTGVTYVAEFSASICKDAGYQSVGSVIEIFAKVSILLIGMPVITALLETIQTSL